MLLNLDLEQHRKVISLTPLIDVVFILLLFFMLTSSFTQWQQINIITPSASNTQTPILRVLKLVSNDGLVNFDGRMLTTSKLSTVKAVVDEEPKATYVITVVQGITTQSIVSLLDKLNQAGAYQVSLAGLLP